MAPFRTLNCFRNDVEQQYPQKNSLLERLANKDNITVEEIRQLRQQYPIQVDEESSAWDFAGRVQRAPQYCRFLKFERLNLMYLYVLQHKLLSLSQPSIGAKASGALSRPQEDVGSQQTVESVSFASPEPVSFSPSASLGNPDSLRESLSLLKEYNEALKIFREMQAWPEASSSSCELARSDFAFLFRDERYLRSKEPMFDLNPSLNARASNSMDGIRQLLMKHLPLRFVNHDEWNIRLTKSQEPGAQIRRTKTGSSRRADGGTPLFVDNLARIIVSVVAGIFLLVPMIALSFIISQSVRLGVTVAFVLVFSLALGWFSKATNDAVMGATAAYAAVLVVFVGQTSPID